VHWTAAALAAATARPPDLLCAASCHTEVEVAKAGALGLDFAVLAGAADAVASGRAGARLGRVRGGDRDGGAAGVRAGRLARGDLDTAIAHGAHGIALRRAAWEAG